MEENDDATAADDPEEEDGSDEDSGDDGISQDVLRMIEVFESEPDWERYNIESDRTLVLHQYWTDENLGGGPLVDTLQTDNAEEIITPLKDLILNTENFGYFELT